MDGVRNGTTKIEERMRGRGRDQGEEAKDLVVFTTATTATIAATASIATASTIAAVMTAVMMRLHGHVLVLHLVNGNGQWDAI